MCELPRERDRGASARDGAEGPTPLVVGVLASTTPELLQINDRHPEIMDFTVTVRKSLVALGDSARVNE
jgi:hypothetical protein